MWTKKTTNPETVLAMKDTGHFAFFSGRNVINLDGLVNSFSYQDVLILFFYQKRMRYTVLEFIIIGGETWFSLSGDLILSGKAFMDYSGFRQRCPGSFN